MSNRKITDMVALTAPASDDVLPIVDISEAAAADKNKKISIEELFKGVPNGTAAAPSIAFESDDDNGIFLAGTNTVGITTAGTQRVTVDSSGNVGIGTTGGDAALQVQISTSTGNIAKFGGAHFNRALLVKHTSDGINLVSTEATNETSSRSFIFSSGSTERLRIDSLGRVGIGTSSPVSNFHVNNSSGGATIRVSSQANSEGVTLTSRNDGNGSQLVARGTSAHLRFYTQDSSDSLHERMRIDSSGRVGVGTASPQNNFHLSSSSAATRLQITNSTTAEGSSDGTALIQTGNTFLINNRENDDIYFATNNTERLRITSDGNVGIGTSSPSAPLAFGKSVFGEPSSEDFYRIKFDDNGGTHNDVGIGMPNASSLGFNTVSDGSVRFYNGTHGEMVRIDSSGRLLVGTSSTSVTTTQILQGNSGSSLGNGKIIFARGTTSPANGAGLGEIAFSDSGHTNSATILAVRDGGTWTSGSSQPSRLTFSTTADGASSPTERLRIDSSGRVMIGTTTNNGAALTVDSGGGSNVVIRDNSIENHKSNSNGAITVNYKGYASGTTQFRDFHVYNGKNGQIATFDGSTNRVGIGTTSPGVKLAVVGTDAIQVPAGTTAQRPTAAAGQIRLNTTHGYYEGYDGTNWTNLRTLVQSYLPSGTQGCNSTTLTTIDVIENNESYSDSLTTESAGVYTFARAGVYEIYIRLTVDGGTSNYRWTSRLRATKNGTSTVVGEVEGGYLRGTSNSQQTFVTMAFTHQFAASDTLTFQIQRITTVSGNATIQVEGTNIIIKALKTID